MIAELVKVTDVTQHVYYDVTIAGEWPDFTPEPQIMRTRTVHVSYRASQVTIRVYLRNGHWFTGSVSVTKGNRVKADGTPGAAAGRSLTYYGVSEAHLRALREMNELAVETARQRHAQYLKTARNRHAEYLKEHG